MQHQSVSVGVGAHVARGDPIAKVGDTGNASGAHVHFGTATDESHDDPSKMLRNRWEARVGADKVLFPCYIPRSTDSFFSTNG